MSVIQLVVIHAERLLVFSPPTVVNCRSFRANLLRRRRFQHRTPVAPFPFHSGQRPGLAGLAKLVRCLPGAGDEARRPEEAVHGHRNPEGKCVEEVEVSAAWISMTMYCFFWPSRFITGARQTYSGAVGSNIGLA
jgi:hypothetical protein